jgi:hypothetical protein
MSSQVEDDAAGDEQRRSLWQFLLHPIASYDDLMETLQSSSDTTYKEIGYTIYAELFFHKDARDLIDGLRNQIHHCRSAQCDLVDVQVCPPARMAGTLPSPPSSCTLQIFWAPTVFYLMPVQLPFGVGLLLLSCAFAWRFFSKKKLYRIYKREGSLVPSPSSSSFLPLHRHAPHLLLLPLLLLGSPSSRPTCGSPSRALGSSGDLYVRRSGADLVWSLC